MGIRPSRSSKSSANSEVKFIQYKGEPTIHNEGKDRFLILGLSDSGKSTLLQALKRITNCTEQSHHHDDINFENNLRIVISWVVERIWEVMGEQERTQLKEIIPDIRSIFENANEFRISSKLQERNDCCEIMITLWKKQFFRDFYESIWSRDGNPMFENVKELVSKIEQKTPFSPFSLINIRTVGALSHDIRRNNTDINLIDIGGKKNERKKWWYFFEENNAVIYMVSLSEFNQLMVEDITVKRVDESLRVFHEIFTSKWCEAATRKIVIFVKPDILKKKLENGVQYNREINSNILPELERISGYDLRLVVNSVISEFFKQLGKTKVDSYHIVNTTSDEEVRSVCEMLFGERTAQNIYFFMSITYQQSNETFPLQQLFEGKTYRYPNQNLI